jgi:hypothetical protein
MTEETLEILYNRLLITSVQADVETPNPTMIFVAGHGERLEHTHEKEKKSRLTNITPKWGNIAVMIVPYQLVDEKDQVARGRPADKEDGAGVARAEM